MLNDVLCQSKKTNTTTSVYFMYERRYGYFYIEITSKNGRKTKNQLSRESHFDNVLTGKNQILGTLLWSRLA